MRALKMCSVWVSFGNGFESQIGYKFYMAFPKRLTARTTIYFRFVIESRLQHIEYTIDTTKQLNMAHGKYSRVQMQCMSKMLQWHSAAE